MAGSNPLSDLWARWSRNADWRDKLHKRAAYKSLDIPEEDVIEANRIRVGLGPVAAVAIALAAGVGPTLLGYHMLTKDRQPEVVKPVDSEYDVRFYDKDGNLITIPQKK